MLSGQAVELGDQLLGGGNHDRIEPGRSVADPSVERSLGRGGYVADVDTIVINMEVECLRLFRTAATSRGRCRWVTTG